MIEYAGGRVAVHHGDCLDVLRTLPDCSVDAVVTDPPYGLAEHPRSNVERALLAWLTGDREHVPDGRGFMGRDWDRFVPPPAVWDECFRVLKPGGHLLAFAAPRTYDLMAISIRLAGLTEAAAPEIRDTITWLTGQGFPKSLDVGKAIDRQACAAPVWDAIRSHIREWIERAGLTNREVAVALGLAVSGSSMVDHWTRLENRQQQIPTKVSWFALKSLLGWPDSEFDAIYDAVKDGADRPVIAERRVPTRRDDGTVIGLGHSGVADITAPATADAARWDGWGTALKPASEPIVVARKPLAGTIAQTVLAHGTGALNINGCRVGDPDDKRAAGTKTYTPSGMAGGEPTRREVQAAPHDGLGRWPSNVVLTHAPDCQPLGTRKVRSPGTGSAAASNSDGSIHGTGDGATYLTMKPSTTHYGADGMETVEAWECVPGCPVAELDAQSGNRPSGGSPGGAAVNTGMRGNTFLRERTELAADSGGASRFFPTFRYQAKADTAQRPRAGQVAHPTVKPLDLMRWLVRLVTPPGGTVLDPFAGSGTTGEAALLEGFRAVLIEREADYLPLIADRLTKRTDPVTHLTAKAARGEDVDLGLFALLEPEDTAHDRALAELQDREYDPWPGEEGP